MNDKSQSSPFKEEFGLSPLSPLHGNTKSPCISVCKYNEKNFCVGCKRHMNEIFDWLDYPDDMKDAILEDIKTRNINSEKG
tara:strand:- start:354 stop:596 length:243 start_codon:yes stop_codon:yes gene_type:complete